MNLADLPPPPPGSNLSIVAESDGVVITLRRERFADLVEVGVLFILLLLVLLNVVVPLVQGDSAVAVWNSTVPYLFWLFFLVVMLLKIGKRAYEREDGAIFFISPSRFAVATTGIFRNRDYDWLRAQLVYISAWQGLRVALTDGQRVLLLKERKTAELLFVAEVARFVLKLNPEPVLGPDELAVTYQGAFWGEPQEAVLHVKAGSMSLRHPLADTAHLRFMAGGSLLRSWWFSGAIPLLPDDVICRLETEGNCRLEIAPEQVRACKGSGGHATD